MIKSGLKNIVRVVVITLILIAMFFTAKAGFATYSHFASNFFETLLGLEIIGLLAFLLMF